MFFKLVGIVVCIVVVLALLGNLVNERQQNQPPTVIQAPAPEANSNIRKYLTEQPSPNAVAPPPEDTAGYQSQCLEDWTKRGVIPSLTDDYPWAHFLRPMDMMVQG